MEIIQTGQIGNGVVSSIKVTEPTRVEKGRYTQVLNETLETGEVVTTTTVIEKELNDIVDIAAGYYYSLALDSEGTVWAWGYNGYSQLGDGTEEGKTIPTKVENLENVQKIYVSGNTSYALTRSGEIYAWGSGYSNVPTKLNFYLKAVDITGKLILAEDGTVWTLGTNPSRIENLRNAVQIASGDGHYAALTADGCVSVWGYNGYGQLSQGNTDSTDANNIKKVQISLNEEETQDLRDIVEITSGNNSIMMLSKTGEIYVSGYSGYGQLGTEENIDAIVFAKKASNAEHAKHISTNAYHTVVSDKSGFVYTTGLNNCGQLGDGSFNSILSSRE